MSEETKPPGPSGEAAPAAPAVGPHDEVSAASEALPDALVVEPPAAPAEEPPGTPPEGSSVPPRPGEGRSRSSRGPRPTLTEEREALYRDAGGFRLRLEPPDLARLRELPGSKGRTDRELGEEFLEKQANRFAASLAEDVAPPAEVRVVVDPYSRQAFLAIDRTIRSILSF
jgi:hypothetical protein